MILEYFNLVHYNLKSVTMNILVILSPISDTKHFMWEYETFSLCLYLYSPQPAS